MRYHMGAENCIMKSSIVCTFQIKKDEMGGACKVNGEGKNA
jgi:hypothetical protein